MAIGRKLRPTSPQLEENFARRKSNVFRPESHNEEGTLRSKSAVWGALGRVHSSWGKVHALEPGFPRPSDGAGGGGRQKVWRISTHPVRSRTQSHSVAMCRFVFRMVGAISPTPNPAYVRSRPTFCIPSRHGKIAVRDREASGDSKLDVPARVQYAVVLNRIVSIGVVSCSGRARPLLRFSRRKQAWRTSIERRSATVSRSPTFRAPIRCGA